MTNHATENQIQYQSKHNSLREIVPTFSFAPQSTLVLFGEIFQRGYANGLVEHAQKQKLSIIYSTVGRREKDNQLRPLLSSELEAAPSPLVNVPLEAGFDLSPCVQGQTPVDLLKDIKLSEWKNVSLDWKKIEESRKAGKESFRARVKSYVAELEKILPPSGDIIFAHLMAGGVPRAKIIMPLMNRVFKGVGDRYLSSKEFWESDLGKLCSLSFDDVTSWTFQVLLDETQKIREARKSQGFRVGYTAYGYHGTEILIRNEFQWQSYSPYLQGWAKMKLENISISAQKQGLQTCVFNCPEILTNSSSIFQGVEVPLYALMDAYAKQSGSGEKHSSLMKDCLSRLQPGTQWTQIAKLIEDFYQDPLVQSTMDSQNWPTHTKAEQLEKLLHHSQKIFDYHIDQKNLITAVLSEKVFDACGYLMLNTSLAPQSPVTWINHDVIAKFQNK